MTDKTVSLPEERRHGSFIKNNLRNYGMLMSLVAIMLFFQVMTGGTLLQPLNLTNLVLQNSYIVIMALGMLLIIVTGHIDLSVGSVAGFIGAVAALLMVTYKVDYTLAFIACLLVGAAIGAAQGYWVAYFKIPSFIVTLAGFLLFSGILIVVLGGADGSVNLDTSKFNQLVIYDLVQGVISPVASWVLLAVVVGAVGTTLWLRAARRRRQGLVAPPASVTAIRIALVALVGVAVVAICNVNRGTALKSVQGVPWVIPIVLVVLGIWTLVLGRTRFGRYLYAIGGNPEAARRAGVSLAGIRTWAFAFCSATAGLGGLLLGAFFYGQYSTNTADPGQLVLYTVAAAVIGGVSLFGGRGKALHGVLGGLLIGGIAYGVSLLNLGSLSTPLQYILPGAVLLAAVLIDVLSRRGAGSVTRV
jgi:putative multiple sugar transport system permease protein